MSFQLVQLLELSHDLARARKRRLEWEACPTAADSGPAATEGCGEDAAEMELLRASLRTRGLAPRPPDAAGTIDCSSAEPSAMTCTRSLAELSSSIRIGTFNTKQLSDKTAREVKDMAKIIDTIKGSFDVCALQELHAAKIAVELRTLLGEGWGVLLSCESGKQKERFAFLLIYNRSRR